MFQYCCVQAWLTTTDGWCHFTELCFPFSVKRCWFIALCVYGCVDVSPFSGCFLSTRHSKRYNWTERTPQDGSTSSPLNSSQRWHTQEPTHGPLSRRKLCIAKWSTLRLHVDPSPVSIQTGRLSLNASGVFNLPIANQWFTSAPSNLGQTGEGVERHDNPLWLRCSADKTSPHRPPRVRRKPVRPPSSA